MKINLRKTLFAVAVLVGSFIGVQNVSAATLHQENTQYYYNRTQSDGGHSWYFKNYTMDGQVAYCIEPGTIEGVNYPQGSWSNTGLPDSIKDRILLIGYYGYTYPGHNTVKYRMATQGMLWDTIIGNGSNTEFTTERWGAGTKQNISAEKAEINRLIANHYVKPSFTGETLSLQVGQTTTLHDNNGVLSNYSVSVSDANHTENGNDLTITPTTNGNITITLTKKSPYSQSYKIFYGDGIQNMMVPGKVDDVIGKFNINAYYGSVEMTKEDSETKTAQGQATLAGAEYGVYKSDGTLITTLTTDENGYAKSGEVLSYGSDYYLKEIKASNGYYLDNDKYFFDSKGVANVKQTVKEDVVKNYISILKQHDYVDGNTTFLNAEANITFEISYPDGTKFAELTTDKNGYATMDIPFGVWKFHQVNTTKDYEKIHDFTITVDYNTEKEQYYNILNNLLNAYLQVFKIDSETGKQIAIANTTFKILNTDTNKYVSQFVGGKVYSEFKTDENGVFTTYLKLTAANYKLVEVSSPKGYLLDSNGLNFTIGNDTKYNYTTYGPYITVKFKNIPIKGQIEINKSGEVVSIENETFIYKTIKLDGIKFNIYAYEDIVSSDGTHTYYNKGDLVDTIISNSDGYAISKKLPLGKYKLVEVETKDNYVLDNEEHIITLTEKDNKTPVVYESVSKLNYLKKGKLEFTKTDLITGKVIPNVKVSILTENDEVIFSGITDKNGKIVIDNLFVGKFKIIETEPSTGYKLSDEVVYFEITDDGQVIKANMTNEKIKGNLVFTKIDEDGNPLAGVTINVYKTDGTLFGTYVTNNDGLVLLNDIEYGDYYIKEVSTIDGYELSNDTIYFSIIKDGEDVKVSMVNKKLPQTNLEDYTKQIGISLIVIGTSAFIIASTRRKKSKKEND